VIDLLMNLVHRSRRVVLE